MAAQNERLAIIETKIDVIKKELEGYSDVSLTLDALVRQMRKHNEVIESDEFIKDRLFLSALRKSRESQINKVKMTIIGVVIPAALTALWYGAIQFLKKEQ